MFRSLQGRINRVSYWIAIAAAAVVLVLFRLLDPKFSIPEYVILILCVPRLHDIGRTGWWAGGALIGELVLVAALFTTSADTILTAGGAYMFFVAVLMIVLGCLPGQPAENRFGPPPKRGLDWSRPKPKTAAEAVGEELG